MIMLLHQAFTPLRNETTARKVRENPRDGCSMESWKRAWYSRSTKTTSTSLEALSAGFIELPGNMRGIKKPVGPSPCGNYTIRAPPDTSARIDRETSSAFKRLKQLRKSGYSRLGPKSGSAARFSDFAIDVRKIVEADDLPEYALGLHKNGEGAEVVSMIRKSLLSPSDARFELLRSKQRRKGRGIQQKSLNFVS